MSWWRAAFDVVALCPLLACDVGGAAGAWLNAQWVIVALVPVWVVGILWVEGGEDG